MTELNQQEQEIVDKLVELRTVLTIQELAKELRWSLARLMPILARLEEEEFVKTWTGNGYPKPKYVVLGRPKAFGAAGKN